MKAFPFTLWLFFIVSSVLGAILTLIGLSSSISVLNGSMAAPFREIAFGVALGFLVFCAVVFFLCLKLRPAPEAFTSFNLSVALFLCIAAYGVIWFSMHGVGHYTLAIHLVDSDKQPIPGVSVKYQSFPLGEGIGKFDHLAEGVVITDNSGTVAITTNHAHEISLNISAPGFEAVDLCLYAAGYRYAHQLSCGNIAVSANGTPVPNMGTIPAKGNILLTVRLPKK